jgi:hypothetical protein
MKGCPHKAEWDVGCLGVCLCLGVQQLCEGALDDEVCEPVHAEVVEGQVENARVLGILGVEAHRQDHSHHDDEGVVIVAIVALHAGGHLICLGEGQEFVDCGW